MFPAQLVKPTNFTFEKNRCGEPVSPRLRNTQIENFKISTEPKSYESIIYKYNIKRFGFYVFIYNDL